MLLQNRSFDRILAVTTLIRPEHWQPTQCPTHTYIHTHIGYHIQTDSRTIGELLVWAIPIFQRSYISFHLHQRIASERVVQDR